MSNVRSELFVRAGELLELGRHAWRWWVSEIHSLLPKRVAALFPASQWTVLELLDADVIVGQSDSVSYNELFRLPAETLLESLPKLSPEQAQSLDSRQKVILRLPNGNVLRRRLALPMAAAGDLRSILGYELERQSPIDPALVAFDYRIAGRDRTADKLEIEMRIVKRDILDRLERVCGALGLHADSIEFTHEGQAIAERRFKLVRKIPFTAQLERQLTPALVTIALVLGCLVLFGAVVREHAMEASLDARVEHARSAAAVSFRLEHEIALARTRIEFAARKKQEPLLLAILNEVSRVLPDGTWIVEFTRSNDEIRIEGFSPAASTLIGIFDNSPLFTNAQFRAPLMQGPAKDLERFDLSFDLKGGAS